MPTTVIKSIGTDSRDYSTIQAWEDVCPSDLTRSRASTTQAGSTSSTIVLDSGASGTDDYYKNLPVWCDARSSEKRLITAYNGTTKTATIGALNGSSATWANTPGTEAYTIDSVIWKGECYNDEEFFSSTGHVVTFSGTTTDATRYPWLTAASGESFQDHADVRTNPLSYSQSKGVGLRTTTSYSGIPIQIAGISYIHVDRLQLHSHNWCLGHDPGAGGVYKDLVMHSDRSTALLVYQLTGGGSLINCAMFCTGSGTWGTGAVSTTYGAQVIGCTLVRSSDVSAHGLGYGSENASSLIRSCAAFGFLTPLSAAWNTKTYNATDQASIEGTNSQTSVTFNATTPFVQADKDSTVDLRAVAATALAANGYKDATNAPNDISGTARAASPTIGAWELVISGSSASLLEHRAYRTF